MKRTREQHDYGECHVCAARMQPREVKQDFWLKGRLVVVEAVPAGACPRCGARVVSAAIAQRLASLLADSREVRRARTVKVPVIRFGREVA